MANQVDFKILPSDQFNVYSPQTRSEKIITYFTLLSKLRGDILAVSSQDDPNNIVSAYYSNVGNTQTLHLVKADGSEVTASNSFAGTVTSVDMSVPTGFAISGNPITTSGTLNVSFASGYSLPTNALQATWTTAYNRSITSAAVTGTSTKTLTLNQQDGGTITASWSDIDTGLTSVGLSMPSAFAVANSPLTVNGTIAVTGAGTSAQYIRGDGQLANFPNSGGGGSTINYYLNGSVNQGTFGGTTYYEMSKTPIAGAGTNFTRTSAQGPGYIASFITDAGDPALLNVPGGNWNLEIYFNSSSSGGGPSFYGEVYKVSSSNVFTLIASNSASPEGITNGTTLDQYFTSIAVPQTTLLVTDRLAVRIYVNPDGRDITIHTEDNNFCEVITTFSTGLNALNGLTAQVQYFATGTTGTDFNINSVTDTHTFNLPTASGTNRGALSSADWTTFNSKASDAFKTIAVAGQSNVVADSATDTLTFEAGTNIVITTDAATDKVIISAVGGGTGSVTSVDMSVPTGFAISGNPIVTSGTLALAFASGYSLPTTASQGNWNTAYNDSITAFSYNTSTGVLTLTQQDAGILTATVTLQPFSTTNLTEGTNLYFTTTRARQSLSAGTGISYDNSTGVITNSAPDQIVSLTAGTGISTSGTYPSFTITNTLPDQTVVLTAGTGITTSGTYPNFTITNSDRGSSQNIFKNIAVAGQSTIIADSNDDTLTVASGTGISLATNATSDTLTITNTAPDQTVVLNAGTGISTSGTYPNFTITNTLPDQTVVLTGAGTTVVTGTYPSFTITSNDQYVGTVTSVATTAPITGGTITSTGTIGITQSGTASDGYLSSTDWNTFNAKIGGSGTTNYVAKFTGGSAIGNSQIFDNGTNVGIGTATPTAKLQVQSSVSSTEPTIMVQSGTGAGQYGMIATGDSFHGLVTRGVPSVAGDYSVTAGDEMSFFEYGGIFNFYQKQPGVLSLFTRFVNGGNNYINGGNVGIGTTAPYQSKLHVTKSEAGATPMAVLRIGNQGAGYTSRIILTDETTNDANISYLGATQSLGFGLGTSLSQMVLTSAGNVGIGTTAPTMYGGRGMEVSGAGQTGIRVSDTAGGGKVEIGSDNSGGYIQTAAAGNVLTFYTGDASTLVMRMTAAGNVGIGTTPSAWQSSSYKVIELSYGSSIHSQTDAPIIEVASNMFINSSYSYIYTNNGYATRYRQYEGVHSWHTAPSGISGNAITFTQAMTLNAAGNLGIGTTSPDKKLVVVGDGTGTAKIGIAGFSGGNYTGISFNGTLSEGNYNVLSSPTDPTLYINRPSGYGIQFRENNAAQMIITSAGNVGIGTTAPVAELNVVGTSTEQLVVSYDSTKRMLLGRTSGYGWIQPYTNGVAYDNLILNRDGGNVGIGTTAPDAKLDVRMSGSNGTFGRGRAGNLNLQNTNTSVTQGGWLSISGYMGNSVANYEMGMITGGKDTSAGDNNYAGHLSFWTCSGGANGEANSGSYERMRINGAGNVGIGNTNPTAKLQVGAEAHPSATGIEVAAGAGGANLLALNSSTNHNWLPFTDGSNYYSAVSHTFRNELHSTDWMKITAAGNVGIGTTGPAEKLSVVGNIRSAGNVIASVGLGYGNYISMRHDDVNGYITITRTVYAGNLILEPYANVGISTTTPSYKLDVSGTIRATGDVIAYSDARVKENIETLDGALDKVMKMRGVSYNKIGEQEKKVGVIAQEILEVLPEVVSQDETGTYSVAYGNISAVLIEAIKELTNTVKEQQKQIDELKSKLK